MDAECRVIECDRCHKLLRLKRLADVEMDGGYSRYTKYEDKPEGWINAGTGCARFHYLDLCPECAEKYYEIIENFIEQGGVSIADEKQCDGRGRDRPAGGTG